jgi:deoxyribose-phosphate aldolase
MVINIGWLRSGSVDGVAAEIESVVTAVRDDAIVKVILETAYLSDPQIEAGSVAAARAGAHFVKTSTGFAPGGATLAHIRLMRGCVPPEVGVKAAGGVRTMDVLLELHEAGATRFGATRTADMLDSWARHLDGDARPSGPAAYVDAASAADAY